MALKKATSAHSMSRSLSFSTLTSTSFRFQWGGSIAETVSSPRGGNEERFPMNGRAWRKLQNVSGKAGYSRSTFMWGPLIR